MESDFQLNTLFMPISKPYFSFYRQENGRSNGISKPVILKNKSNSEKAEIFLFFFQSIFSKSASITHLYGKRTQSPIRVPQQGVYKMLCELKDGKKAAGLDGLTKIDLSIDMNNTAAILKLCLHCTIFAARESGLL